MADCKNCGNRLEFIDRIFFSNLCFLCQKKDLENYKLERKEKRIKIEKDKLKREEERIKNEEKNRQKKKAIDEIEKYTSDTYDSRAKSNQHLVEFGKNGWSHLGDFAIFPYGNHNKPLVFDQEEIVNPVIKNNYNVKSIFNDLINKLVEDKFIEIEANKILESQRKRNIREKTEKKLYGTVKTKRKNLTEEEKEMIFDKFNTECVICGKKEGLHIHHKDENSSNNQINNLVVLCGVCHKKTHMRIR